MENGSGLERGWGRMRWTPWCSGQATPAAVAACVRALEAQAGCCRLPLRVRRHGGVDGDHGVVRGQEGDGCVSGRQAHQRVPCPGTDCTCTGTLERPGRSQGQGTGRRWAALKSTHGHRMWLTFRVGCARPCDLRGRGGGRLRAAHSRAGCPWSKHLGSEVLGIPPAH